MHKTFKPTITSSRHFQDAIRAHKFRIVNRPSNQAIAKSVIELMNDQRKQWTGLKITDFRLVAQELQ